MVSDVIFEFFKMNIIKIINFEDFGFMMNYKLEFVVFIV